MSFHYEIVEKESDSILTHGGPTTIRNFELRVNGLVYREYHERAAVTDYRFMPELFKEYMYPDFKNLFKIFGGNPTLDHVKLNDLQHLKASPTVAGNVRCMDCRCGGFGCKGMPDGYEAEMMAGVEKWT